MGKRYAPRHAAPGKHEAPRKATREPKPRHTTAEKQDESKRQHPKQKRKASAPPTNQRQSRQRGRKLRHTAIFVLAAAFVLAAVMAAVSLLHRDELEGTWALDDTTVYEFDGRGHGTLRLPLGSYAFDYSVEGDRLMIDFADETAADAEYSYTADRSALTLDTNTGTVYQLKKQK